MSPKEAATLTTRKISSKHTFWLVLGTTPLLASFFERFHGITCSPNSVGVLRTLNL